KLNENDLVDLPINYTTVDEWEQLAVQKDRLMSDLAQNDESLNHLEQAGAQLETEYQELKEKVLPKQEREFLLVELNQVDERLGFQSRVEADPLKNWQNRNTSRAVFSLRLVPMSLIV